MPSPNFMSTIICSFCTCADGLNASSGIKKLEEYSMLVRAKNKNII
jgi:hypothetical protein